MLTTKLRIALSLVPRQSQLIPHKMSNIQKKEENRITTLRKGTRRVPFLFWKTHIPCVFRVFLRTLKGNKKGWRTEKWFSSQVPWRTTIPGHNHYVQYNKKVKKVKRFAN